MKYKIQNKIIEAESVFDAIHKFNDEASSNQTIEALIQDEEAAVAAYGVAIKNLKSTLSEDAISLLLHILDEEKEHIKELHAIASNQDLSKFLREGD